MATNDKQRGKLLGGITGKGFVKGDPRINRTKPGPGRPPLEYRKWLESMEPKARAQFEDFLTSGHDLMRFKAALDVFDRLHGRSNQPITVSDLSGLLALAREDTS